MGKNEYAYREVEKAFREDENFNKQKKADELGINPRTVYKILEKVRGKKNDRRSGSDRRKKRITQCGDINEFRDQFDDSVIIPKLIEEGIEKYLTKPDGEPAWMTDKDFREACGVPHGKWRRYAEDYKHIQAKKGDLHFWGHPDIIDEMRAALNR